MHHYRQVLLRLRAGEAEREIARSRLMGREKVARLRALATTQGWLEPTRELPDDAGLAAVLGQARRARSTISSVEPYRAQVTAWAEAGVQGKAIHAALCRDYGYTGSYSSVARLLVTVRASRPPEVTVRLSYPPGEAAQVDFGAGPLLVHPDGQPRRTWAFVMTLCHSRHQYVEFVWDQSVATWLGCHRRAFEWFGGVPGRVIIDNAKCAITKACVYDPLVQRAYAACAEGYGFKIEACPPADPQKKGIVEAGVKYVKRNFLPLREARDLAHLNAQARVWIMKEAGERCHGTTRVAPLTLFALERGALQPLPAIAPDLGTWHQVSVHRDCHVQFERALYSVPFTVVGKVRSSLLASTHVVYVSLEEARRLSVDGAALSTAVLISGTMTSVPDGLRSMSPAEAIADAMEPLKAPSGTIAMVRTLLWLVAGLVIGSVLYVSALERTRDMAVFKAVGTSSRSIAAGLAMQAVVIAAFSTMIAALLAALLAPVFPMTVELSTRLYLLLPVVAVAVALVGSLGGMRRALVVPPALAFGAP